jgi:hypothetical protein
MVLPVEVPEASNSFLLSPVGGLGMVASSFVQPDHERGELVNRFRCDLLPVQSTNEMSDNV